MSHTKRVSKRPRTSVRLRKAEPAPLAADPLPQPDNAATRLERVDAARKAINDPAFDPDARLAAAVTKLIEREIG
jgi:hypothetical protein